MKLTKKQIESYQIRFEDSFYWADINIDCDENSGRIQIASDFGDWQYYFGSCGKSFKNFLIGLDIDYLARKFGVDSVLDMDATVFNLRNKIVKYTQYENKESKTDLLEELQNLHDSSSESEFMCKLWNSDEILKMEYNSPDVVRTIDPTFKRFWNNIWNPFVLELEKELKQI